MADRTLRRPMFRRGGFANEGIMSGLRDQSVSADGTSGGLNSLVRPGYAEGDVVEDDSGYSFQDFAESPVGGGLMYGIPGAVADMFYTPANLIGRAFGYNPGWSARKDIRAQKDKWFGEDREGRMTDEEVERSNFLGIPFSAKTGSTGAHATEWEDDPDPNLNQPKIVDEGTGAPKTSRADDITAIYEDLLPMLQGTLGVDKGELGRQKYLELAKFGANLMAQPGGSLTRAIGKAAADPLAGLTRIGEQQRISKRVPAELAMKIALRETEGGQLMKNARDLMKADPDLTLKEAMAKVMPADAGGASKLIMGMAQKGGLGLETGGAIEIYRGQIEQLLNSPTEEIRNLAGAFDNPLPKMKDLGEEEIGNYYVNKKGQLLGWDGTQLLFIDDTGFTGKTKKRKKKKK